MSTILKWAGNKTAIMQELLEHLPAAGLRLVEPFAGSCAVMMATDYPAYLIADINPDLINMYRVISSDTDKFIELARAMFGSHSLAESYYRAREAFNYGNELGCLHRAVYFLYLNRHSYRGLCRYNKSGGFNVPFGNYKAPYFPETEIRAFAEKAKRATFVCANFDETLAMLKHGDVIYCDPPYDGTFNGYHSSGFGDDEQYHLASILERRSSEGYPVIVSNADTSLTSSLYRTFTLHRINVKRSIGVEAGSGKAAREIIAVSKPKQSWPAAVRTLLLSTPQHKAGTFYELFSTSETSLLVQEAARITKKGTLHIRGYDPGHGDRSAAVTIEYDPVRESYSVLSFECPATGKGSKPYLKIETKP